ncbi:MAG TPA: hypothetical protein VIS06_16770 [Mycobacteriales bacterium]
MTDLEGLLRETRQEIREGLQAMRAALERIEDRTVPRGEYVERMSALERRVSTLESARRSVLAGLIWPALLMLAGAAVTYLMATRGGGA